MKYKVDDYVWFRYIAPSDGKLYFICGSIICSGKDEDGKNIYQVKFYSKELKGFYDTEFPEEALYPSFESIVEDTRKQIKDIETDKYLDDITFC